MSLAQKINLDIDSDSDSDSDAGKPITKRAEVVDSDEEVRVSGSAVDNFDSDEEVNVSKSTRAAFDSDEEVNVSKSTRDVFDSDEEDIIPRASARITKEQRIKHIDSDEEEPKKSVASSYKRPKLKRKNLASHPEPKKLRSEDTSVSKSAGSAGGIDPDILNFAKRMAQQLETKKVVTPVIATSESTLNKTASKLVPPVAGDSQALLEWPKAMWKMWKASPTYSEKVPGSFLAASKLPLSTSYEQQYGPKSSFTVDDLVQSRIDRGEPVGLFYNAVSAAESRCYLYEKRAFGDWDAEHHVAPPDSCAPDAQPGITAAHARLMPPSRNQVAHFVKTVTRFASKNPGSLVVVASAMGHNRAGCLIVAYLVEVLRTPLAKALADFAAVRPPGVYSPHALEFLHRCYQGTTKLDVMRLSAQFSTPPWECKAGKEVLQEQLKVLEGGQVLSKQEALVVAIARKPQPTASSAPPSNAPPKPSAPEPWKVEWSRSSKRYYFFNPLTKTSVWKLEDCK